MHIFLCKTAGHRGGCFGCARQIVKSLLTWNLALWSWGLLVPFWLSREGELKRPRTLMLQSRACPTTTSAFERSLRGERHRTAHGPSARARPPHHRPPCHYCRGGHHFCRSPDISDLGVHSTRRPASERSHRRRGPTRSRYLARRRPHRHLARYARAQHPRGTPMLERH